MALIEKYHVIADHYAVNSAVTNLIEGMFVKLNTSGEVVKATGAGGEIALGVSGDTKSTSTSGLPTTNASSVGAFVNRVSDNFDETRASGRCTVYHSGGVFATNQYTGTVLVNDPLYVDATSVLTATPSTSAQIVGYCVKAPGPYESGVPGTDVNGSLTLGNYMEFKLVL